MTKVSFDLQRIRKNCLNPNLFVFVPRFVFLIEISDSDSGSNLLNQADKKTNCLKHLLNVHNISYNICAI